VSICQCPVSQVLPQYAYTVNIYLRVCQTVKRPLVLFFADAARRNVTSHTVIYSQAVEGQKKMKFYSEADRAVSYTRCFKKGPLLFFSLFSNNDQFTQKIFTSCSGRNTNSKYFHKIWQLIKYSLLVVT